VDWVSVHFLFSRLTALQVLEAFTNGGQERGKAFADGAGVAREIDYKRTAAGAGSGTRENSRGHFGETDRAHCLTETGHLTLNYIASGFWGNVSGRGAGAARGYNEVAVVIVTESAQGGCYARAIVGDDADENTGFGAETIAEHAFDFGAT